MISNNLRGRLLSIIKQLLDISKGQKIILATVGGLKENVATSTTSALQLRIRRLHLSKVSPTCKYDCATITNYFVGPLEVNFQLLRAFPKP